MIHCLPNEGSCNLIQSTRKPNATPNGIEVRPQAYTDKWKGKLHIRLVVRTLYYAPCRTVARCYRNGSGTAGDIRSLRGKLTKSDEDSTQGTRLPASMLDAMDRELNPSDKLAPRARCNRRILGRELRCLGPSSV